MKSYLRLPLVFLFLLVIGAGTGIKAQSGDYSTAIGIRAGWTSGITFKHFFTDRGAFEGIFFGWPYGMSFTGLFEAHSYDLGNAEGLKFYYGGGGHIRFFPGWYRDRPYRYYWYPATWEYGGVGVGIDGIIGLEYKIPPIPLAISLDFKPFMEFNTLGFAYFAPDFGLGVKVAF